MESLARLGDYSDLLTKILATCVIIFIALYLSKLMKRWIIKVNKDAHGRYQVGKAVSLASIIFTLIIVSVIWIDAIGNLGAFLGIIGAGIAVALKDPLTSVAGWFYLSAGKLYTVGDRIQVDKLKGDVVDISIMKTTLLEIENWVDAEQGTGRIVHIPNHALFGNSVYNYTRASSFVWTEIHVVITYESDWQKAMQITKDLITPKGEEFAEKARTQFTADSTSYLIKTGKLTPISYIKIVDHGVKISTRFLVPVRQRRSIETQFQEGILTEFAKHDDITLAYITYRITNG